MRRRSIAILSQYYPPEVGAPQARVLETARALSRRGHRVTVLTAFPNHPTGVVPPRWRGRVASEEREPGATHDRPLRVLRSWLLAAPNRGAFRRTLGHLTAALTTFLRGLSGGGGADVFLATSPPLFTGLAGLVLARIHHRPFVLDVRDLWPDAFVDLGLAKEGLVVSAFRRIERLLYRRATRVVPVTESFAARIAATGVLASRIEVIRNGVDVSRFARDVLPPETAKARAGVAGRFVVLYLGAHGVAQGLDRLLPAAKDAGPRTTFLFVGDGAEKPRLVAEAERLGLGERAKFLAPVPRDAVPGLYAAADVVLVALRATPLMGTFLPSKLFEAMGAGKPVVAAVAGEAKRLLESGPGAVVVPPEDADALSKALRELASNPAKVSAMGREARARAEREFDRDALSARYLRVLEGAIREHRARREA